MKTQNFMLVLGFTHTVNIISACYFIYDELRSPQIQNRDQPAERSSAFYKSPLLPSTPQPKPVDHVNVESVTIYKWYDLWYYFNAIWASLPGLVASYIGFNIINVSNVGLTRLYVRCLILFIVLSSLPAVLAVVGCINQLARSYMRLGVCFTLLFQFIHQSMHLLICYRLQQQPMNYAFHTE